MKSVLILGATSDVAKVTAQLYAKRGFSIVLSARNHETAQSLSNDIRIRYNVECKGIALDILDFLSHKAVIDSINPLPEITICYIGYLGDQEKAVTNWDETLRIINTNYTGPVSILNIIARKYEEMGKGVIVGVSSVAGERGRQSNYTYGSAKAAFTTYLEGLRNRLYHKSVHVVSVKPGFMATKMTENLKLPNPLTAQPEKAAKAIIKAIDKKEDTVYVLWMWKYIMFIIKNIPEAIFKKLKL